MLKQKIIAFFTAIITVLTLFFCPAEETEGVFTESEVKAKTEFDEGVFEMKENDLVVSPDGDDSAPAQKKCPLKHLKVQRKNLKM